MLFKVTASNPVSSQTQQVVLMADHMTPLAEAEFLSVQGVVAVNATHLYTIRVKVDVSLPVTFRHVNNPPGTQYHANI